MSARRTVSGDLALAQERIVTLVAEIDKLTKAAQSSASTNKWASERADKAEKEVAAMHDMLDLLPNAPPRELPPLEGQYSPRALSLAARLIGYIAQRSAA